MATLLKPSTVQAPDFAPQTVDDNAHKMEDENTDKLETQEGGGAISLTYSTQDGGLLGVHHEANYARTSSETYALVGCDLLAEVKNYIVKATVTGPQ